MPESLEELILSLTPEDSSPISSGTLLAQLRHRLPGLAEKDYRAACHRLIDNGLLCWSRGQRDSMVCRGDGANDQALQPQTQGRNGTDGQGQNKRARGKTTHRSPRPVQLLSYHHGKTRVNNPEVGMVHGATDPDGGKTFWAHDPHLDPVLNFDSPRAGIEALIDKALASQETQQMKDALLELKRLQQPYLHWTGKAEKTNFAVDTVSLHVHERVDPATILANVKQQLQGHGTTPQWQQPDLFAPPFENLPLRQALEFYRHEKGWANRLVLGDSLLVMNSLLRKETMAGQVQMIYFDPPYGIKYGSNFQPFTNKHNVEERDEDLTREPEMIKAFRDTWQLGIHSYLTYLRDRLLLARELLSESGSIFVQIGDENVHYLAMVLDEIFGAANRIATISFATTSSSSTTKLPQVADYLLWYGKDAQQVKYHQLYENLTRAEVIKAFSSHVSVELADGSTRKLSDEERFDPDAHCPKGTRIYRRAALDSQGVSTTGRSEPYTYNHRTFPCSRNRQWSISMDGLDRLAKAGRLEALTNQSSLMWKKYEDEYPGRRINNIWPAQMYPSSKRYVVETSVKAIQRCLLMTTDPGDLVLDLTCGSGTTPYVAEQWGRRWITCDTSRVAITLAKQRLMTAYFDYYTLRHPHRGTEGGFNYETVPYISPKTIASNQEIDTIYAEDHPKITAALERLNVALATTPTTLPDSGEGLQEWQVPFTWPQDWPETAREPFDSFHRSRQAMKRSMDQSIGNHAPLQILYNKPQIDKTRLRITGPFSVEAVPAPTVLALDEALAPDYADNTIARSGETQRQALWCDELLKTGVRGKDGTMLHLAELEAVPSLKTIHASGALAHTGEPVVVSFGPAHGALEQRQVERALGEAETMRPAVRFILFCAFTFDPEAAKDIDSVRWPGVTLLKVQMNTDLLTEDLKRTCSSNQSFWLMGQPDVELRRLQDGLWQVEVHGFDYFDLKGSDLTSGGKQHIAMWLLDTNYDQRSLMPNQVFFPMAGNQDGWKKLSKTVRAQLDETLLNHFHSTISLPFEAGDHQRVAVKIVDNRGIESLKVLPLEDGE